MAKAGERLIILIFKKNQTLYIRPVKLHFIRTTCVNKFLSLSIFISSDEICRIAIVIPTSRASHKRRIFPRRVFHLDLGEMPTEVH